MLKLMLEEITKNLPQHVKDRLIEEGTREDILSKYGEEAFLDSENKKYPVINPNTGKYRPDLIYSSYLHAAVQENNKEYYQKIKEKAKTLFEETNSKNQPNMSIDIRGFQHSVIDITEMMFLDEDEEEELDLNWIE